MRRGAMFGSVLLWSIGAGAGTGGDVEWRESDVSSLFSLAEEVRARDVAPEVLTQVSSDIRIDIEDEVIRTRVRDIWYYPSVADVQRYGMDKIVFDVGLDSVVVHAAATLDRHGELHLFDPETARIRDTYENNIFTDTREMTIALPGLGVGGLTLLDYEIITRRDLMETDWSEVVYPASFSPLERFRFSVRWEEGRWAPVWQHDDDRLDCEATKVELLCGATNLPAADYEENIFWADKLPRLVVGERESWSDIIDHSLTAFQRALVEPGDADSLLASILEQSASREDAIDRVHDFVARDVRYLSMSEHGHTITPHSISTVLRTRYGDCKDKSALLYYLLSGLDLDVWPVLVATRRMLPAKLGVPAMGRFDHMLVCFALDGEQHCLDATDPYTDWRHTPAGVQGRVALPLRQGADPGVIPENQFRWRKSAVTSIDFTPEGGQREVQERRYVGEYAGAFRGFLTGRTPAERVDWARENYQEEVSDWVSPDFSFEGVESLSETLAINSSVEYPPFIDVDADLTYVEHDAWLRYELNTLYLQNRRYDEYFPGARVKTRYEYDIGRHWTLATLPPELTLEHELGALRRSVTALDDSRFVVETVLAVPSQWVAVDRISEFNRLLEVFSRELVMQVSGKRKVF